MPLHLLALGAVALFGVVAHNSNNQRRARSHNSEMLRMQQQSDEKILRMRHEHEEKMLARKIAADENQMNNLLKFRAQNRVDEFETAFEIFSRSGNEGFLGRPAPDPIARNLITDESLDLSVSVGSDDRRDVSGKDGQDLVALFGPPPGGSGPPSQSFSRSLSRPLQDYDQLDRTTRDLAWN